MTSGIPLQYLQVHGLFRLKRTREKFEKPGELLTFFNRIPTLDGWRAVAVIGVVLYHWISLTLSPASLGSHLASRGRFGVDLFFAISGFLICGRILQEVQNQGTLSLASFYIRRAFRILPPVLVYLAVLAGLMLMSWTRTKEWELTSTLLFVRNYFPLYHHFALGRYTAQFWSLAVEEHFYLTWPFVLVLLRKHLRAAATITFCVAIAVFVWRTVDSANGWLIPFGTDVNSKTDTRFDALLWGCLAAFAYPYLQKLATDSRVLRNAWKVIVPLAMLLMVFQNIPGASLFRAVVFPVMIISTALSPLSALSRILNHSVTSCVGRMSYSIYIWQQLALFPTLAPDSPLRTIQQFPLDLIAIAVTATLSYYLVERPMIRLGHRITQAQGGGFAQPSDSPARVAAAPSFAR